MPQSRYRSLSGALVDLEKRRSSNEYDGETAASSSWSSRDTSGSYLPMLGGKPKAGPSIAYQLPRRRFARWFTLSIVAILVTFSLYLVHASLTNAAGFRVGQKRPLPPPAYEQFPFLKRYHGGVRALVDRAENKVEYPAASEEIEVQRLQEAALEQKAKEDKATSKDKGFQKREAEFVSRAQRFNPLPDYASEAYTDEYEAPKHCYLDSQKVDVPQLLGYKGIPQGFPDPVMGSYELLGLRNDVCFERYGRLSPYGYGYSQKFGGSGAGLDGEREGSEKVWDGQLEIDYGKVDWGQAQEKCTEANKHRFKPAPRHLNHFFQSAGVGGPAADSSAEGKSTTDSGKSPAGKKLLPRTAVIIRTWWDYQYGIEELFYLRALINELSLQSSGEYTVHFLVHVKDDNKQIWSDDETYQKVLNDSLPAEFRGMGTLWSERQMGLIYGGVDESMYRNLPVHGVYRSTYMPVQYFAHMHPEYDFFWHWEMDARYTGHFYELFSKVGAWAKEQPRKGLWERNGRFYVPSEHGSWDDFRQMVRVQTDHGTAHQQNIYQKMGGDAAAKHPLDTASRRPEPPIWGPLRPSGGGDQTADPDRDPQPPTTFDQDNYAWGVGEDADFITFNPLFDPHGTNWILAEDVTGYNTSAGFPPRRTAIVTASRLSRRLLETMHRETALQRHTMFTEMWPGSCALHHGLKAVYAPHPVYIDRAWPTSYLAAIFNNGRNGASGGARTSVFSDERQINFKGTTWYYNSGFAPNLWKRWLGYKVDNDGGEQQELANEGRMCLPPMLLHPIKHFEMVYEHKADK